MENWTVRRMESARIPTLDGEFELYLYQNNQDDKEHLALVMGDIVNGQNVPVRIHSECFTGDVIGSQRCDCGEQLQRAMALIAESGRGVIIYLRQEGRGIGLLDKLRAYNLQDEGYDTVEANLLLGHEADERDYTAAALMIRDLGVESIRLLTNNPDKIESLRGFGIPVTAREPLQVAPNADNAAYLAAKANRLNHLIHLEDAPRPAARKNGNGRHPRQTAG